jgi:peptide-methionine (S)-S-oxide reductase
MNTRVFISLISAAGLSHTIGWAADPAAEPTSPKSMEKKLETATLGAGCYWCVEAVLQRIKGIEKITSGFMGGHVKNPSYQDACAGTTGHAEVVQLEFDPAVISYEKVLEVFWKLHDPTTLNRQGADVGTQYRSAIYYHSDEQKKAAEASKKKHQSDFNDPIVTEITASSEFYSGPAYHQDYFNQNKDKNPYCRVVIWPKLKKLGLETK